ncbi:hypothetical protein LCGC14_2759130 [marine sediment metagenome]|uniref:Uncharacterized protein n=1 Tax=marine sediment metagenome TaxID=412755 RepID=A0A0F8YZL5_9ZZZZ
MEHTETKLDYIIENERLREINSELLEALEFEQQISLSGDAEAYPQFVEMRDAAIKAAKGD